MRSLKRIICFFIDHVWEYDYDVEHIVIQRTCKRCGIIQKPNPVWRIWERLNARNEAFTIQMHS